jgi:hypothetical protein
MWCWVAALAGADASLTAGWPRPCAAALFDSSVSLGSDGNAITVPYASSASEYGTDAHTANRNRANAQFNVEPMTGIEPAYSAWEADVLPLNYIGLTRRAGDYEG